MAATDTVICNMALDLIKADNIVDLTNTNEAGAPARLCRRWYANVRDTLLSMSFGKPGHSWAFATKRTALVASAATNYTPYAYIYDAPNGTETPAKPVLLKPLVLLDSSYYELPNEPFVREGTYIYTDLADAYLKYIGAAPAATTMPEYFVTALAWKLATYLVKPLNGTPISDPWIMAEKTLAEAIGINDNESMPHLHNPDNLTESRFGRGM